jgi:hypothetical protein
VLVVSEARGAPRNYDKHSRFVDVITEKGEGILQGKGIRVLLRGCALYRRCVKNPKLYIITVPRTFNKRLVLCGGVPLFGNMQDGSMVAWHDHEILLCGQVCEITHSGTKIIQSLTNPRK